MGRRGRRQGERKGSKPLTSYHSDDDPDPESNEYYNDDVDDFHAERNKILLDEGYKDRRQQASDEEEEVLNVISDNDLLSSEDDDDEIRMYRNQLRRFKQHHIQEKMGSDLEDEDEDTEEAGLPDSKAWGSKRSRFYHADVIDDKFDFCGSDEETGKAAMEEKEALAIQKKMAEELEDQDFGLDMFTETPSKKKESKDDEEKISKDLSKLSKREKLELLKKESPELLTLIEDYITKLTEVKEVFQPLLALVKSGKICGSAADYVKTRYHLNMNYCMNVSFYLVLKSKHIATQSHPVIKRLVQYRNLMKQLEPVDAKLKPEIEDILERLEKGEDVDLSTQREESQAVSSKSERKKRKLKEEKSQQKTEPLAKVKKGEKYETEAEKEALEYYDMMKKTRLAYDDEDDDDEDEDSAVEDVESGQDAEENVDVDEEGKRAITYQIAKNKGMTQKKKKEQRNPRVKHRKKFEKAKVRRKGQVRETRKEMQRYGGELSGIRAGIKRGIKLR